MPTPTSSLATLRPDLAASLEEFNLAANRQGFIGQLVMPVVDVASQAGVFGIIPIEQLLQDSETARAPGGTYNRGNFRFGSSTYACEEHGYEEPIDDRQARMYANYFDAEMVATARAYDKVLAKQERRAVAALTNTSVFTGALTGDGGTDWDQSSSADPRAAVETAIRAVRTNSGLIANAVVMSWTQFRNAINCDAIVSRLKYQGFVDARPGNINAKQLAAALGIDRVIVAGSVKNTATEGQAATIASVWPDDKALVCRVAQTSDFAEPCVGRTFHWSADGSNVGGTIETYRSEERRSDIVRVRHDVDEVILYPEAGYLITGLD